MKWVKILLYLIAMYRQCMVLPRISHIAFLARVPFTDSTINDKHLWTRTIHDKSQGEQA
jgi:hypothetical protein